MLDVTQLKNGTTFLYNGKPYKVLKYTHIKMGRGGAIVRVTVRNLENQAVEDKTFSSNVKVQELVTTKRKLQFLYKDGQNASFIDPKTYEQVEIPIKIIKQQLPFIKEGESVNILFWDEKALSIEIPPKVTLRVIEAPPGVRGDSATNIFKTAVLENGLKVKVPLFVNKGERIVIDTRTGEYVERSKE